ncbi:hypothetical protein WJX73_003942 [Symbiochloris irregularis]|uniref:Uncharacterized protein n=1 Tax=Symbiochloris irregularis TaxID=706552 RepID=A0AAW1P2W0_9CHLO
MAHHGPFKWVRPEVYPLLAALAVGVGAMAVALKHSLFSDPVVTISRGRRGEDPTEVAGQSHYNHWVRRFADKSNRTILPDFYRRDEEDEQEAK